jgi:hypothetical protein
LELEDEAAQEEEIEDDEPTQSQQVKWRLNWFFFLTFLGFSTKDDSKEK